MRALLLAALLLHLPATALGQAEALLRQPIVSVAYTSDGLVQRGEIESLVTLRSGEALTEAATGTTIRNLFATRRFSNIQVEAEPAEGGVAVTVHLFRSFRVNPLRFEEDVDLPREEMRRAIPFSQGAVFSAEELEEGAAALKRRLDAEGYIGSVVEPEVAFDWKSFDVEVLYRVEGGKPSRAARPIFDGATGPFAPEELLRKARLEPGGRYRESSARADAERITRFLLQKGFWKGSVELIAAQPTENSEIIPVYRVSVGPRVVIETGGVRPRKVRREIEALLKGQIFNEDLLLQYVEGKRRELQRQGHYRALVDYKISETPEQITVRVTVEEGEKFSIEKIRFAGNHSVRERKLRELIVTQEKGLPLLRSGRLVDDVLAEDARAILGHYQAGGWIQAKLEKPSATQGSKPDRLVVEFPITEGPRTVVADRRVVGAASLPAEELERTLRVEPGEPFNPAQVRQDALRLQSRYREQGWPEASVREEWTISADQSSADVLYRVEEGVRSFFGTTIVRGNTRTDTGRIARLVSWDRADPFSEEEIFETQRSLTRTGVFQRVELHPQLPDPATQIRNVDIEVREGRPLTLLYGAGYRFEPGVQENRNDPFALLGASYNNLFGKMFSAGIEAQYAPLSSRGRAIVSFREPFLFNADIPLTMLIFYAREPIQEIDIERWGGTVDASRTFGKYLRAGLRYEYQIIGPVDPSKLSQLSKFDRPIQQSAIGPNLLYDRRDDVIDPRDGYYFSAGAKYAFPLLSADARYTKVSGQGSYFRSVGRSIVAVSARAGGIFPYGPREIVPIAERFFAGGPSTNRAFQLDLLGIPGEKCPDDPARLCGVTVDHETRAVRRKAEDEKSSCVEAGYPELEAFDCDVGPRIVGGNGFFALNAELRFPIFGNFGGTLFYDASQVWEKASDIEFRLEGNRGLRQGVGLGIQWMSPIGPVRAGYGFVVDPRQIIFDVVERIQVDEKEKRIVLRQDTRKERIGGRFFVSIGYPF